MKKFLFILLIIAIFLVPLAVQGAGWQTAASLVDEEKYYKKLTDRYYGKMVQALITGNGRTNISLTITSLTNNSQKYYDLAKAMVETVKANQEP